MTQIVMTSNQSDFDNLDGSIKARFGSFLAKLLADDTNPSLHIEPMHNAADKRACTGRVNDQYRAVMFKLHVDGENHYLFHSIRNHDDAIKLAQRIKLKINPINGVAEVIEMAANDEDAFVQETADAAEAQLTAQPTSVDAAQPTPVDTATTPAVPTTSDAAADTAATVPTEPAGTEAPAAATPPTAPATTQPRRSTPKHLSTPAPTRRTRTPAKRLWEPITTPHYTHDPEPFDLNYTVTELTDELGLPARLASTIMNSASADDILHIAEKDPLRWRQAVLLELSVNTPIATIKDKLGLSAPTLAPEELDTDKAIVEAIKQPASSMQFAYAKNQDELRRVIEDGDMGAWRIFLHPEQRKYVTKDYNGTFRLRGGAGTGKTVVLLHRANHLAEQHPDHSIYLTTYNKTLAANLHRDFSLLNPDMDLDTTLSPLFDPEEDNAGIHIAGTDSLAHRIISDHRNAAYVNEAGQSILGFNGIADYRGRIAGYNQDQVWREAIDSAGVELDDNLADPTFLEDEYIHIILGKHINNKAQYARVPRPGRGAKLGRDQRLTLWAVFEAYRRNNRVSQRLSFPEVLAIAAETLNLIFHDTGIRLMDHVLIDEAQDFHPAHWLFIRALVGEHPNDIFICEDNHQRIYSTKVALRNYGIHTVGRSRTLTVNYRTTAENLKFADHILRGANYVDLEGETEDEHYVSVRNGPEPLVLAAADLAEEYDRLAELLHGWLDGIDDTPPVKPEGIAILARTSVQTRDYTDALIERGIPAAVLKQDNRVSADSIRVLTMHRSKGMEFTHVVLVGLNATYVPMVSKLEKMAEEDRDDALLRERSLLYVAATRARDQLVVAYNGDVTPFLHDITAISDTTAAATPSNR